MSGFVPPNAVYVYSFRVQNKVERLVVLLTLALAWESPTCILHEGINTPCHSRSKYHTQLAKLSFAKKKLFGRFHSWSVFYLRLLNKIKQNSAR